MNKFGSIGWAKTKIIHAYLGHENFLCCHGLVGKNMKSNQNRLDKDAYIQFYTTPSGMIAHSAIINETETIHNPEHISGEHNLSQYKLGEKINIFDLLEQINEFKKNRDIVNNKKEEKQIIFH